MTDPKLEEASRSGFGSFWFISGGNIHRAFKYRKWSQLRDLAMHLPKIAWDKAFKAGAQFERERILGLLRNEGHITFFNRQPGSETGELANWLEAQLDDRTCHADSTERPQS